MKLLEKLPAGYFKAENKSGKTIYVGLIHHPHPLKEFLSDDAELLLKEYGMFYLEKTLPDTPEGDLSAEEWCRWGFALFSIDKEDNNYGCGLYQPILDAYNRAIELDPNFSKAYFERGDYLSHCDGRIYLGDAIEDITQAIKLDPSKGVYYIKRGEFFQEFGDEEWDCFDDDIKTTGTSGGYQLMDAIEWYEKAIANFEIALHLGNSAADEKLTEAQDNLEYILECIRVIPEQINRRTEGITQAIKLDPSEGAYYIKRGELFQKLGDKNFAYFDHMIQTIGTYDDEQPLMEAIEWYEKAIANFEIALHLGNSAADEKLTEAKRKLEWSVAVRKKYVDVEYDNFIDDSLFDDIDGDDINDDFE
jgi:tetratricopeptide (TPR) repeat protein